MINATLRPAELEDIGFIARAILAATRSQFGKGWFDIALNKPEDDCLEFLRRLASTTARSQWHYTRFWIAANDGKPVATLCAVRAADAYPNATAAILQVQKSLGLSPAERASFWQRGAYLFTCTLRPTDESLTIEVAATLPEYRGQGHTTTLLAHALEEGRRRGLRMAETTCFVGNLSAERAYLRAGFHFENERRHPQFENTTGSPGIRRFVKEI